MQIRGRPGAAGPSDLFSAHDAPAATSHRGPGHHKKKKGGRAENCPPSNATSTASPATPPPRTKRRHHRAISGASVYTTAANDFARRAAAATPPSTPSPPRARKGSTRSSTETTRRRTSAGRSGSTSAPRPLAATMARHEVASHGHRRNTKARQQAEEPGGANLTGEHGVRQPHRHGVVLVHEEPRRPRVATALVALTREQRADDRVHAHRAAGAHARDHNEAHPLPGSSRERQPRWQTVPEVHRQPSAMVVPVQDATEVLVELRLAHREPLRHLTKPVEGLARLLRERQRDSIPASADHVIGDRDAVVHEVEQRMPDQHALVVVPCGVVAGVEGVKNGSAELDDAQIVPIMTVLPDARAAGPTRRPAISQTSLSRTETRSHYSSHFPAAVRAASRLRRCALVKDAPIVTGARWRLATARTAFRLLRDDELKTEPPESPSESTPDTSESAASVLASSPLARTFDEVPSPVALEQSDRSNARFMAAARATAPTRLRSYSVASSCLACSEATLEASVTTPDESAMSARTRGPQAGLIERVPSGRLVKATSRTFANDGKKASSSTPPPSHSDLQASS